MNFIELDLIEVDICNSHHIKEEMGLKLNYYPLHKKVEYEYSKVKKGNDFFSEGEMDKLLTILLGKEATLDGEYIDDIEELDTLKVGEDYLFALYYILEDVDFALIRVLKIHESQIKKALLKK